MEGKFFTNSLFVAANTRKAVEEGRGDYIPIFLSECPSLFRKGILPLDVALIQVSLPDKHGFCSLGVSVDISKAAAKTVIAQVNVNMPRTHGDGIIPIDKIHSFVEGNLSLHEHFSEKPSDIELAIGKNVASLIENGATLQMGIGVIPNAVLTCLTSHKDLGIHKKKHPGKIVSGFVMGTRKLYDFIDDNPEVSMLDISYINDPHVIRKNPKVTAIEVDLTGQVCADTIGTKQYSDVEVRWTLSEELLFLKTNHRNSFYHVQRRIQNRFFIKTGSGRSNDQSSCSFHRDRIWNRKFIRKKFETKN